MFFPHLAGVYRSGVPCRPVGTDPEDRPLRSLAERQEHDLVFPSRVGTPVELDNLRRSWGRIRKVAKIGHVRFHDIRVQVEPVHLPSALPLGEDLTPRPALRDGFTCGELTGTGVHPSTPFGVVC